ncbi:hypothetical protein C6497_03410 [Candidatus Poribacteria bacterium]|nr:MAG: hypothetical protein C6497_03410 [Candidatus Poribacteria bacterium]
MMYIDNIHTKFLLCIIGLYLLTSIPCVAQMQTGTLSGIVLDRNEEPVQGFTLTLSQGSIRSKTNEKGEFSFNNIPNIPVQLTIPWNLYKDKDGNYSFNTEQMRPDYEVISTKIGEITIHNSYEHFTPGVKFSVKPGTHIKDVVVIVRPRMRIRTRVLQKDGTPLANTSISKEVHHADLEGAGSGSSSGGATTDSEGYFNHYIQNDDVPAEYTVTVKHQGKTAKSEKILIEDGTRYDDLVLTLDTEVDESEPKPVKIPTEEKAKSTSLPSLFGKLSRKPKKVVKPVVREPVIQNEVIENIQVRELPVEPPEIRVLPVEPPQIIVKSKIAQPEADEENTLTRPHKDLEKWLVNPENGHAYRKIRCKSLKDAKKQAALNGAYLVAINDENEQKWLSGVFGNNLYWIGLSDEKTEGQWVWENGEPLTYSNWGKKGRFPRSTLSPERQDAVVLTFINGLWQAIGPGDLFWGYTKYAILEKDD